MPLCTYDEIFEVFAAILDLLRANMKESALRVCLMALLDRYTVRNRAYHHARDLLVDVVLNTGDSAVVRRDATNGDSLVAAEVQPRLLEWTVKICLFEPCNAAQSRNCHLPIASNGSRAGDSVGTAAPVMGADPPSTAAPNCEAGPLLASSPKEKEQRVDDFVNDGVLFVLQCLHRSTAAHASYIVAQVEGFCVVLRSLFANADSKV